MSIKEEHYNSKRSRDNTNKNTIDKLVEFPYQQKSSDFDIIKNDNNKQTQPIEKGKENTLPAFSSQSNELSSSKIKKIEENKDTKTYGHFLIFVVFCTVFVEYISYVVLLEIKALTSNCIFIL